MAEPETIAPRVGKYELLRKLSAGGMAEIFLARTVGPGGFEKTVVLKRVLPHLAEDPSFVSMFLGEARLVARFNHPNVVQVFDFGEDGGTYFLVMEYIDGLNLRQLMRKITDAGETMPVQLACRMVTMACEGLAYAHEAVDPQTNESLRLIHRDISPDNLLVSRDGSVKVVDFGIAKAADLTSFTRTGQVRGKFSYMAPEQLLGEPIDLRVDVFALGVVLYEFLAGRKPWGAENEGSVVRAILDQTEAPPSHYRQGLPDELDAIVRRALAKKAEDRYPDCRAMQADLDGWLVAHHGVVGQRELARLVQRFLPEPGVVPRASPQSPRRPLVTPASGLQAPPLPLRRLTGDLELIVGAQPAAPLPVISGLLPSPSRETDGGNVPTRTAAVMDLPVIPVRRGRGLWVAGASAAVGLGAILLLTRLSLPGTPAPTATAPVAVEAPVAAQPKVEPAAVPTVAPPLAAGAVAASADAGAAGRSLAPAQAPTVVAHAAQPTQQPRPPVAHAPRTPAPAPSAAKSPVEFRIRPFGTVYVDGALMGDTPLDPVDLPQGKHQVRLVNRELGREVTLTVDVVPGPNVVRQNFEK